jgi:hypothetical protein
LSKDKSLRRDQNFIIQFPIRWGSAEQDSEFDEISNQNISIAELSRMHRLQQFKVLNNEFLMSTAFRRNDWIHILQISCLAIGIFHFGYCWQLSAIAMRWQRFTIEMNEGSSTNIEFW